MSEQEFGFETQAIRTHLDRTQFQEHSTPLYLSSSFVFEDAEAGVEAALAAGMRCIGIGSPDQLKKANKVIHTTGEFQPEELAAF